MLPPERRVLAEVCSKSKSEAFGLNPLGMHSPLYFIFLFSGGCLLVSVQQIRLLDVVRCSFCVWVLAEVQSEPTGGGGSKIV